MRYSRLPPKKQPQRNYGKLILIVLLIAAGVYIFTATAAGNWLADNVVTPVFSYLDKGAKQQGINDLPAASKSTAASASAGAKVTESMAEAGQTYYLLQTGAFENEQNATDSANEIKKRGGAGYIIKDGTKNRVILAAYKTEDQARSVKDSLKNSENIDTYIYTVNMQGLNYSITAGNTQTQAIKDAFALPQYCADTLIQISQQYDTSQSVDTGIQQLKDKCETAQEALNAVIKSDEKNAALISLKNFTQQLCDTIGALPDTSVSGDADTSAQLKYTVVWIVQNDADFLKNLS